MLNNRGILIVVSGFSGAGKGTVMKRLMEKYNEDYALSVSMTTRGPRNGEVDGVHYFFVSREQFEENISKDGFIEHAQYCGNYYGTPKAYVEKQLAEGKNVILEIEIQGALLVKEQIPETLLLFVTPPNAEELKRRLVSRGTETMEQIEARLKRAIDEAPYMADYDYIVLNDEVENCVDKIHELVDAAKNSSNRNREFIEKMKKELAELKVK